MPSIEELSPPAEAPVEPEATLAKPDTALARYLRQVRLTTWLYLAGLLFASTNFAFNMVARSSMMEHLASPGTVRAKAALKMLEERDRALPFPRDDGPHADGKLNPACVRLTEADPGFQDLEAIYLRHLQGLYPNQRLPRVHEFVDCHINTSWPDRPKVMAVAVHFEDGQELASHRGELLELVAAEDSAKRTLATNFVLLVCFAGMAYVGYLKDVKHKK